MRKDPDLALLGLAALCLGVLFVATTTTTNTVITDRSQTVAVLPSDNRKRKALGDKDNPTVEDLENQLKACLEIEDYETAAILRDEIKYLKFSK